MAYKARYKLIARRAVIYGAGRPGVMLTYCKGVGGVAGIGRDRLRYVLRAGKKGTGGIVASAECVFNASDQARAQRAIAALAGDIRDAD